MNFIKKLSSKEGSTSSSCCGVEIKEVKEPQEESCCGTSNRQESSCC